MNFSDTFLGLVFLALGLILFIYCIGDLLLKILGAFIAILIINHGLSLLGRPKLQTMAFRHASFFRFR